LAITRRWQLQLSRVDQENSLKRRAGAAGFAFLLCLREFGCDLADQTLVLRQAKQKIHPIGLAPAHQRLAGEPRIGAQHNAHVGPSRADLPDEARRLFDRAGRRVEIGAPQLGRQQMPAAENVQRQVAIAVVVAVKEPPLLMPVQRVVGGVQVENDLLGRVLVRFHEQSDKQRLDLGPVPGDAVIARQLRPAPLQPVECRFASQGRTILATSRQLAGQHRHRRVVTQLVVIDQVFVAQRQRKDPLPDQSSDSVLDQLRRAAVDETLGKPIDQPDRPVRRPQQQGSGIRSDLAALKPGHHHTPLDACKPKQIRATLCLHRVSPWPETNRWSNTIFSDPGPRCTYPL
jgi:hypothetical protein